MFISIMQAFRSFRDKFLNRADSSINVKVNHMQKPKKQNNQSIQDLQKANDENSLDLSAVNPQLLSIASESESESLQVKTKEPLMLQNQDKDNDSQDSIGNNVSIDDDYEFLQEQSSLAASQVVSPTEDLEKEHGTHNFRHPLVGSTYYYSYLDFHAKLCVFTFSSYTFNSHGTTETLNEHYTLSPTELYDKLEKECGRLNAKQEAEAIHLDEISRKYNQLIGPYQYALDQLSSLSPMGWEKWTIDYPLHIGNKSLVFLLKSIKEHSSVYHPLYHKLLSKHSYMRDYLPEPAMRFVERENARTASTRQQHSAWKLSTLSTAEEVKNHRLICAFLMNSREEETIVPLHAWYILPADAENKAHLSVRMPVFEKFAFEYGVKANGQKEYTFRVNDNEGKYFHSKFMPPTYVLSQGRRIAKALSICHRSGIIHRDVTIENLFMLPYSNNLYLGDFDIACTLPATFGQPAKGTPGYMPKEMLHGLPFDYRTDVFALGRTLQLMLWGNQLPFIQDPFWEGELNPMDLKPRISKEFFDVLSKATSICAVDRYQDGNAFLKALMSIPSDER